MHWQIVPRLRVVKLVIGQVVRETKWVGRVQGASLRCGAGYFTFATCVMREFLIIQSVGGWRFRFDMPWWLTESQSQFSFTESFIWDIDIVGFLAMKP
uniref:Uncharacterized protein n=1 Tax=Romanomermis culicivorax TaxID=13658 RepID=A0A915I578_ROMCU